MSEYNKALEGKEMPSRMRRLPITDQGWPQLFFAAVVDGKPDLRIADPRKKMYCYNRRKCWLCGGQLYLNLACVLGPMCVVTGTTSEPACHPECARFAAKVCPFLTKPRMKRNGVDIPENASMPGGIAIMRNPGCCAVYITRSLRPMPLPDLELLFRVGDPVAVEWYCEGHAATREEVMESVRTGMPLLEAQCEKDKDPDASRSALLTQLLKASTLLPAA